MLRTKIICTLGPASDTELIMDDMLRSGMNVARINMSHGTHDEHKRRIETFRAARDRLDLPASAPGKGDPLPRPKNRCRFC
jgi:pyruvate kinase